jgi:N-acetyl-anhydromuramyl-L-alanine amidase AmpD
MKIFRKMNKKGDKMISVYWFVILFIVAAAVVYMVAIFYGAPKNVKEVESKLLANKVAECISQGGYLKNGILGNNYFKNNLLKECNINFSVEDFSDWKEKEQYYLEVGIYKFNPSLPDNIGEKVFNFSKGNINLKTDYLLRHKRTERKIDMIVLHYSATSDAQTTVTVLEDRKLSIHYIVDKDGTIVSSSTTESKGVVDEGTEAKHAGCYNPDTKITFEPCESSIPSPEETCCINVNPTSIGIEIVNSGNEEYTPEQITALEILVSGIISRYNIPVDRTHIIGHDEVAPGYKSDPGSLFPWPEFMANVKNEGEEVGLGRSFYVIDKTNSQYVVKILPLIGKSKK